MGKKICCIFNYPPHYRKNIYSLMDKELNCDFYFGKNVPGSALEEMDCSQLCGFKSRFKNIILKGKIIWNQDTLKLLFKKEYNLYILSVDTICISEWLFLLGAKLIGKRTFLWCHGWYGNEGLGAKFRKKNFYRLSSGLLLYSEYAQKLLLKEGFQKEHMTVIANSLDYDNQLKLRKSLIRTSIYSKHFGNDYPVVLFIGRLESKKKLNNILYMANKLCSQHQPVNIIYIGKGTDMAHLQKEAAKMKLESSVWFFGPCYDEAKIAELIFNADICLSPGNVGLTSIHALTYGTPVITHNNFAHQMPEFEAIIDGKNGTFFEENNLDDMIRVVSEWLYRYPSKTQEIIDACYHIIDEKYNPYYQIEILKKIVR